MRGLGEIERVYDGFRSMRELPVIDLGVLSLLARGRFVSNHYCLHFPHFPFVFDSEVLQ